jgi:hypothetical protein
MQYNRSILKARCCSNYICLSCCSEYLSSKGIKVESNIGSYQTVCPHCVSIGFATVVVGADETIRDYGASNSKLFKSSGDQYSPLKVGDDFESLKRKMIPFQVDSFKTSTSGIAELSASMADILQSSTGDAVFTVSSSVVHHALPDDESLFELSPEKHHQPYAEQAAVTVSEVFSIALGQYYSGTKQNLFP